MISKMGIMDIGTSFILNGMSLSLRNEQWALQTYKEEQNAIL